MVMRGYRHDPEQTARVLDGDGWLATGDVAEIVDGRVRVFDRKKDLVISGGVNVSPTEVEGVLAHHAAVADVCVIGAPDAEWGERVVAYVVVTPGLPRAPSLDELREFAGAELSVAKLPRELVVVDEIPRSRGGKPLRRLLREQPETRN
jgi:acyl-CoA synthetase (AMP-forming)/AMP-acid ligase II